MFYRLLQYAIKSKTFLCNVSSRRKLDGNFYDIVSSAISLFKKKTPKINFAVESQKSLGNNINRIKSERLPWLDTMPSSNQQTKEILCSGFINQNMSKRQFWTIVNCTAFTVLDNQILLKPQNKISHREMFHKVQWDKSLRVKCSALWHFEVCWMVLWTRRG